MEGAMTITNTNTTNASKTTDVLFQKLGTVWYVFSQINGEVVYSAMPDGMDPRETKLELFQVIEQHLEKVASNRRAEAAA